MYKFQVEYIILLILSSPIDIPNFGGQHRSGNFPLTPPDSDGPDSPDVDQGKRIKIFYRTFKLSRVCP